MKNLKLFFIYSIAVLFALQGCKKEERSVSYSIDSFKKSSSASTSTASTLITNSLTNGAGQDPWVIRAGGFYYYCGSTGGQLWISKAGNLQDVMTQPRTIIYTPPAGTYYSANLWAPELHYRSGRWYVYFAADNGVNENHKMYVLAGGTDSSNPLNGTYTYKSRLIPATDRWAIDGHPFDYNGVAYLVWSGWETATSGHQNIYIAKMSNPYTISGDRVEISRPDYAWEKVGSPMINEGPTSIIIGNRINIIYSASGSWTNDYCLGRISTTNINLMSKSSWVKNSEPVFKKFGNIYGPGHASFTTSPDGLQNWIVYHSATSNGSGWDRVINVQQFTYEALDAPYFGTPIEKNIPITAPSINASYAMPITNGTFRIKSNDSGLFLDVPGQSQTPGTQIHQYTENFTTAQQWVFTSLGNGYYKIISVASGLALGSPGSKSAGTIIVQDTYQGVNSQQWRVQDFGNGNFQLTNRLSLMNLNVPNSNPAPGTQIEQWYVNQYNAELWKIIP